MATSSGRNRPAAAVSRSSRARCAWPTGRSEQLTCRLGTLRLAERALGDAAHQLGVIPAGHAGHARQAGVVVQVGIGIDLEDPHPPLVVQPEVHPAVPLALHHAPRRLGDAPQLVGELLRDARRADRDAPQVVWRAGFPLAGIGQDGPRALGHATEVDLRDGEHAAPDEPDVELAPPDVFLHEHVVELLRHRGHAGAQRAAVRDHRAAVEPRARVFRRGFDDRREGEVVLDLPLRDGPAGHREPRVGQQRVRDRLAAARGEGPEARAGDGNPGELERADDVLLPLAPAVDAFAQIEHDVGPPGDREPPHVVPYGDLANFMTHRAEDRADLVHGLHHAADVLRRPVLRARVVQDDDPHAGIGAWAGTACRAPTATWARARVVILYDPGAE